MRVQVVQEHRTKVGTGASVRARPSSLLEVAAISLAWPVGLIRFVQGLMVEHPGAALQGLIFFLAVFVYVLVRLYQLRRID